MDAELKGLLDRAKDVELSPDQIEEHRIVLAAANGNLSDERITIDTMRATRTIMKAAEQSRER